MQPSSPDSRTVLWWWNLTEARFYAGSISGSVTIPGSKSFTQRYILYSAFSGIPLVVKNLSGSDDEHVAIGIARSTGADIIKIPGGIKIEPDFRCPDIIAAGESATSLRISLALLSGRRCRTTVEMLPSLSARSSDELIGVLSSMGARMDRRDGTILLRGENFRKSDALLSGNHSSQFITALLMMYALPPDVRGCVSTSRDPVSPGYIDITLRCLSDVGIRTFRGDRRYCINGLSGTGGKTVEAETDMSSLSAIVSLGVLASNEGITIEGVRSSGLQPDHVFVDMLARAGFNVRSSAGKVLARKSCGDTLTIDADATPDLAVHASVIGIFSKNGVTIKNTGRLKGKESDRKTGIVTIARAFGADVAIQGSTIRIKRGGAIKKPSSLHFSDHRLVMASVIASIAAGGGTEIGDLASTGKSFPQFADILSRTGVKIITSIGENDI